MDCRLLLCHGGNSFKNATAVAPSPNQAKSCRVSVCAVRRAPITPSSLSLLACWGMALFDVDAWPLLMICFPLFCAPDGGDNADHSWLDPSENRVKTWMRKVMYVAST